MLERLARRVRPLLLGVRGYMSTWRGLVALVLGAALVFATDLVDVHWALNAMGLVVALVALVVLLSSASRSGGAPDAPAPAPAPGAGPDAVGPDPESLPSVSLVVTAYNDERFIRACLQSVVEQRHPRLEVIVIDDCGNDGTADIVRDVMATDGRIRLVRHDHNRGLAAARNTGLAVATGEYVAFLDGDDFLLGQSIAGRARRLATATQPDVAGSYCGWQLVPEEARNDVEIDATAPKRAVSFLSAAGENPFIATAPMLRRQVAVAVGGFDEELRTGEDFDFWMRILRQGWRFVGTGGVGVAYRQKRGGMVAEGPAEHAVAARKVYDYLDRPMFREEIAPGAPAPFDLPLDRYEHDRRWMLRVAQFVTFAQYAGGAAAQDELLAMLPDTARADVLEHDKGLSSRLDSAMRRLRLRDPDMSQATAERIRSQALTAMVGAVGRLEAGRVVSAATGPAAEVRFGSYDEASCRSRGGRRGGAPAH